MSFLYDPPALVATGSAIGRRVPEGGPERLAETAVLAVFLGTSVALYRDDAWTRPLVRLLRARSGRDWMLNSGITDFDEVDPPQATHRVAAVLFATYPLWLRWGIRRGRRHRRRGRTPRPRTRSRSASAARRR